MKVITTWLLICFVFLAAFSLQAQEWEWTLSAKPDINSGIYGISMLPDGMTGWGVGSDSDIGRIFHTTDGWQTAGNKHANHATGAARKANDGAASRDGTNCRGAGSPS